MTEVGRSDLSSEPKPKNVRFSQFFLCYHLFFAYEQRKHLQYLTATITFLMQL